MKPDCHVNQKFNFQRASEIPVFPDRIAHRSSLASDLFPPMAQGCFQEQQDMRINSVMEHSNSMTIEYLRARLLAERTISKSARERAEELAKRVAELEEQLKIVSAQRKKSEKATSDILAILEKNGLIEISEPFDSSSDRESFPETKIGENSVEVDESSADSKDNKNETGELSASAHDPFSMTGSTLSCKDGKKEPNCLEKFKESLRTQRISESVYFSSPKPRQGKPCRQIKRRESRSVAEGHNKDRNMVDFQENGVGASSEVLSRSGEVPHPIVEGSELRGEKDVMRLSNSDCLENENSVEINMERALEHHAQLIGRFEDMERAQREWEEKFGGNYISNPDSCDPGNHSDVTDESDETKTQAQHQVVSVVSMVQEARSAPTGVHFAEESSKLLSRVVHVDSEPIRQNEFCTNVAEKGNRVLEHSEAGESRPQSSDHCRYGLSPHGNRPALTSTSQSENGSRKEEASRIQKGAYALVPQETSKSCGSVLEALKQARLSLREKVCSSPSPKARSVAEAYKASLPATRMPSSTQQIESVFTTRDAKPSSRAPETERMVEIPVGFAGLFRVPADWSAQASKNNLLGSSSQPALWSHSPDTGLKPPSSNRFPFAEFSKTNLLNSGFRKSLPSHFRGISAGDRLLTAPYVVGSFPKSGFPMDNPPIASSDPTPTSFYPETVPRTYTEFVRPIKEGFSTSYPRPSAGPPPNHRLSHYGDNFRLNRHT